MKTTMLIAALGVFVYVFGADFQRGWDSIQTRERIVARWNQNDPDEQFSTSEDRQSKHTYCFARDTVGEGRSNPGRNDKLAGTGR
jgi:hypothetical protein